MLRKLIFVALLAHSGWVLYSRWNTTLLGGPHEFRESQTAISVYWMLHGGPWLTYWTPVLGPPWTAPFEFPLYQWIVALLAYMGMAIDNAGRFAAWVFGILSLYPLSQISTSLGTDSWIISCLYLASPLYLLWGTSFLIETTALFFAAMFLATILERRWIWATILGCIAALVKLPTFVVFAVASMLL